MKKILILNLFFLTINSADLPNPEKNKLMETSQKDYDDAEKIVINLAEAEHFYLGDDIFGTAFEYTVESLSVFRVTNISKSEYETYMVFTAATPDGYLSCTYIKEDKSYICHERYKNSIYFSKNGKRDFDIISALFEKQEKAKAK